MGEYVAAAGSISSTIRSANRPLPLRKEARGGGEAVTSYCFASNEATKGRSPSGGFAIALWKLSPALYLKLVGA